MSFSVARLISQKEDQGAWLWCSKDDYVIDAVRKVCATFLLTRNHLRFQSKASLRTAKGLIGHLDPPLNLAHMLQPVYQRTCDLGAQMTRGNVGSLLVFDPSKINLSPAEATSMKAAQEDAVVGIVTERGKLNARQHLGLYPCWS